MNSATDDQADIENVEIIVDVDNVSKSDTQTEDDDEQPCPDGGWGWVACMGAFFIQFLMLGVQNAAGIIYTALVDEFQTPRGITAWVGSLATGMMFFLGPLTTSLCERYGCRVVEITGTLLCITGCFLSSFANSVPVLFFTYGIIWGAGTSMCYFPTIIVLSKYFKTRLSLVNGIVTSGSGLGTLSMGPLIQLLISSLGVFNAFRVIAGLLTLLIPCAATFRPVPPTYKAKIDESQLKKKKKFFDWEIFKNKGYVLWCVCLSIFMLGYFVPFVHLVRHAEDLGVSSTKSSLLIGYLSIASTFGRLLFGKIADFQCLNKFHIYQFGFVVMATCSFFVTLVKDYTGFVVYAVVFGLFEGCYVVLIPVITRDIVGTQKMSYALGSMFTFMAFPMMVGPPIAGWIYDATRDYTVAFYVCGVTALLPAFLMFLVPCITPPRKDSPRSSRPATPKDPIARDKSSSLAVVQTSSILLCSYHGPGLLDDRGSSFEAPKYDIIKAWGLAEITSSPQAVNLPTPP